MSLNIKDYFSYIYLNDYCLKQIKLTIGGGFITYIRGQEQQGH